MQNAANRKHLQNLNLSDALTCCSMVTMHLACFSIWPTVFLAETSQEGNLPKTKQDGETTLQQQKESKSRVLSAVQCPWSQGVSQCPQASFSTYIQCCVGAPPALRGAHCRITPSYKPEAFSVVASSIPNSSLCFSGSCA